VIAKIGVLVVLQEASVGSGLKLKTHQGSTTESTAEFGKILARETLQMPLASESTENALLEVSDGIGLLSLLLLTSTGNKFAVAMLADVLHRKLTRFASNITDYVLAMDLDLTGQLQSIRSLLMEDLLTQTLSQIPTLILTQIPTKQVL
jgi:hypothetical protein